MTGLYRDSGIEIYEKSHYSHCEHIKEVEQILTWYIGKKRILDIGCSGGLHAIEFAKRGFSMTGIDLESSAIALAKERCAGTGMKIEYMAIDIEHGELSFLQKFDLIYSIGNVLSHVQKNNMARTLRKIRGLLDSDGIFMFDVLVNSRPFKEEIFPGKNDNQIIWKRKIDEKTGKIFMEGDFLECGFKEYFEVWGYSIKEIIGLLDKAGFNEIEFSEDLDFMERNIFRYPVSLYFRAKGCVKSEII